MARMPDKKALLQLPLPKLPKHTAEDTCIAATIEVIDTKWVLNLYIRKPKFEVRIFFSEGSWKNYIPAENKWSVRTIEGNSWTWNDWIKSYNHQSYKTNKDSIGAMATYFGLCDSWSLFRCLRAMEDYQSRKKDEEWHKKIQVKNNRRAAAEQLFNQLDIPPRPAKSNPAQFREAYRWQDGYFNVTYCPHCGETTYDLTKTCEYCGSTFYNLKDVATMKNRYAERSSRTLQMYKHGEIVYVVVYELDKTITFKKNGRLLRDGFTATETEECFPLECYVFAPGGKIHTFYSWSGYGSYREFFKGKRWNYGGNDIFYNNTEFEPLSEEELQGTVLANLHYNEYRKLPRRKTVEVDTLKYIEFFHKYPVAENLLMNGFGKLLRSCMYNPGLARKTLHLKQPRLYKMLDLNKDEQQRAKEEGWSLYELQAYKIFRDRGKILSYDLLKRIGQMDESYYAEKVAKYADMYNVALYLAKQNKKYGIPKTLGYWYDYITAAESIEYDVTDKAVLFPPDVEKAHDRAVLMKKNIANRKYVNGFKNLSEAYAPYSFEKDGICIRIAHTEEELINEGKILCHCVGGYGQSHINGGSIFFVRQSDKPDKPWYTLQVNLREGREIQLHGYHNDRDMPIPQEVHDFVRYWLENVFVPFDVNKMEFIKKKPKLQSTAS